MFIFYLIIFIFGLFIGSFLNCVIYRLVLTPKIDSDGLEIKETFLRGRSFCPHCKRTLGWQDLIPILSFFILKSKCRYCQKKISWQYPLVEIATGLLFVLCFLFVPDRALFWSGISCFLIIIFVYDLKHYIIPDKVIFPAIGLTLIYNLVTSDFIPHTLYFLNPLIAAFGAAGFFLFIVLFSQGKWMGLGDVKLAFFMGLLLGFPNILAALFSAFLIGAIIGVGLILAKKKTLGSRVPFGPFLVIGTFIASFWGETIINWYLNLIL